jgi:coenzyme F420-reducing hydrogenase beta subunit
VCPVKAIDFIEDSRGFMFPNVDETKCIECGKCVKSCQLMARESGHTILGAFALQIKDKQILYQSSSGGAFSALAKNTLEKGGIVYGCVFDNNCVAVYRRASTEDEIEPMRGSKYVWADASECYDSVKDDLNSNLKVLFCGLPCQVSGLILYLGKEYPNLTTMDFLCGGPPSPKVFKRYIDQLVSDEEKKDLHFQFRDKEKRGVGYGISFMKNGKKKFLHPEMSSYMYLFSSKLVQRDACFNCQFRGIHRVADITVGDYWGVNKVFPELDEKAGVSCLIVSTEKGMTTLAEIEDSCTLLETTVEDIARKNILRVDNTVKKIPIPNNRDAFFEMLNKEGYRAASMKYTITKKRIKMLIVRALKHRK